MEKDDILKFHPRGGSYFYNLDDSLSDNLNKVTRRITKLLKYNIISEKDIHSLLWTSANNIYRNSDILNISKTCLEKLSNILEERIIYISPNYSINLWIDVDSFKIGPVRIKRKENISVSNSNEIIDSIESSNVYELEVKSTLGRVRSEAEWMINVAISLLRLYYKKFDFYISNWPRTGAMEQFHFQPSSQNWYDIAIASEEHQISPVSQGYGHNYRITQEIKSQLETTNFAEIANTLFNAKEKSIGERIYQGLGWMTKARQTDNLSERFMFFSISLESILTSDDNNDPVVQTLTRNAGTILSDNPKQRDYDSREVRRLYGKRNSLVHRGIRAISEEETYILQSIVEDLYLSIIDHIDLNQKVSKFQDHLKQASFGLKWPI